jgi:hypothetical protein
LALKLPRSPSAAARLLGLFVSAAFRCVKSACSVLSPATTLITLPLSIRIMPYIVKHASIRRWLAPKMHGRVTRMVDYRLGFLK